MNRQRRLATWTGAVLGMICALLIASAHGAENRQFTEEFHHTYPLAAGGRIELNNVNGAVHISAWDQNQVKVDAVKYAGSKERLDQAQIQVEAGPDYISIRTEYKDHNLTFNDDDGHNPAGVEYTLTVPRSARLDEVELVNGPLDVKGIAGEVRASCVNGELTARDLGGRAHLSAVNGRLDAQFTKLSNDLELSAVNGTLQLTLPSDANARLEASNVNGGIENDFGLHVNRHRYVGQDLKGELGSGGTRIRLSDVNGRIEIRHADDNRALSPARDLNREDSDQEHDDDDI